MIIYCPKDTCSMAVQHYNDVKMSTTASQITQLFAQQFFQAQIKDNIKAPCRWPVPEEFTCYRKIPLTKSYNAENVSVWWRHDIYDGSGVTYSFFSFRCFPFWILLSIRNFQWRRNKRTELSQSREMGVFVRSIVNLNCGDKIHAELYSVVFVANFTTDMDK